MSVFEFLDDPIHIARLQKCFGVEWKNPNPKNSLYPKAATKGRNKQTTYVIKNKLLYHLAHVGSELAGKPFYYWFYPACQWIFDPGVARLAVLTLAVCMYIGQSLKGVLRQPRPSSPPVIRLDELYEAEYGMPSTHSLAAVCFSFGLLMYTAQIYEFHLMSGIITASAWSFVVLWSRIYLGMHSLLQITAGVFLGLGLVKLLQPAIEWFHYFQLQSTGSALPCAMVITTLLLCVLTFKLDRHLEDTGKLHWTTAPGDTTEILGWTTGFFLGSKYMVNNNFITMQETTSNPLHIFNTDILQICVVRYLVCGLLIMLPVSTLFRKSTLYLFRYLYGYTKMPVDQAKKEYPVEISYKYTNTFLSGWFGVVVLPIVLQHFNIW